MAAHAQSITWRRMHLPPCPTAAAAFAWPAATLCLPPPMAFAAGIAFMKNLTRRRRVASAHQAGLQTACSTRVPAAHIRWVCLGANPRPAAVPYWRLRLRPFCTRLDATTPAALSIQPCPLWCRWLGLTAFQIALRRKQARYGELLAALDELAAVPALRRAARQLAPVVAPARNSVFEGILY